MTPGYNAPLYRLVFFGLLATALLLLGLQAFVGGDEHHEARPVSSTSVPGTRSPTAFVVTEPAFGAHLAGSSVTLRGKAEPGATIVALTSSTTADEDGTWSMTVDLPAGTTQLAVLATAPGKATTKRIVTVTLDGGRETTTTARHARRTSGSSAPATTSTAPPATTTSTAPGTTTTVLDSTTTLTTVESTTTTVEVPSTTTTTGG